MRENNPKLIGKKGKISRLVALPSPRLRCGELTVFLYPRVLKKSRIIPTWDEELN